TSPSIRSVSSSSDIAVSIPQQPLDATSALNATFLSYRCRSGGGVPLDHTARPGKIGGSLQSGLPAARAQRRAHSHFSRSVRNMQYSVQDFIQCLDDHRTATQALNTWCTSHRIPG